jgi:hypothetical protein
MVQERFAKMEEYGEDWDDKPVCWTIASGVSLITITWAGLQNDMLMWLMTEAKGVERSVEGLARRLLLANFTAIHTTSSASVDISSPSIIHS